ncbi:MAG: hypothetical protein ACI4V1_08235, partial [Eubacteriales bacterium]
EGLMKKITMGRTRKKSKRREDANGAEEMPAADAVFVLGAAAVCVMLAFPMLSADRTSEKPENTAIMAMSSAVETAESAEREEVVAPSNTAPEEKWSFYDYIGELFAGLLSGQ